MPAGAAPVLSDFEVATILDLRTSGLDSPESTLAVLLATRTPTRPRAVLVDFIRQFPSLENEAVAELAVDNLMAKGWIMQRHTAMDGQIILGGDVRLAELIAEHLNAPTLAGALREESRQREIDVKLLGPMMNERVYSSYLERLTRAQTQILLPSMRPSAREGAATVIQGRARAGVRVKVLLASDDVVKKLWGVAAARTYANVPDEWRAISQSCPTIEVRTCHSILDMALAPSVSIDGCILRLDIYDNQRQRTLDGIMIEVVSFAGLQANLTSLFDREFERAWRRAEPYGLWNRVWWRFVRLWQWLACACFGVAAVATIEDPAVSGILGSVSATFLVNALAASSEDLRARFERFMHALRR